MSGRGVSRGGFWRRRDRTTLTFGELAPVVAVLAVAAGLVYARFAAAAAWRAHLQDAPARSALETVITMSALLAAVLLTVSFRVTRRRRELLLLAALVTAGLTDLAFGVLPAYGDQTGVQGAGARIALRLLVAVAMLAAAMAPPGRTVPRGRHMARVTVPVACAWVVLGQGVIEIVGPARVMDASGDFGAPAIALLIGFALLAVAAVGFAGRHVQGDEREWLLAAAALMMAGAELSRLAVPLTPADWVTPGDLLRLGFFCLTLGYALRVYLRSREQLARDAVAGERLRIARDLHDGLAQDLAFIVASSERAAGVDGMDRLLAAAASRALRVAQDEIVDLEASGAPTVEQALREVALELGERFGITIDVAVNDHDGGRQPDGRRRELVRIAREAIVNAAAHGGARTIDVTLGGAEDELLLRVVDDGCGISGATRASAGTGLGIGAMRDRAHGLGGRLLVRERTRGGVVVEVVARRRAADAGERAGASGRGG